MILDIWNVPVLLQFDDFNVLVLLIYICAFASGLILMVHVLVQDEMAVIVPVINVEEIDILWYHTYGACGTGRVCAIICYMRKIAHCNCYLQLTQK